MNEASSITPAMSSVLALLAPAINFPTDENGEKKRLFDLLLSFSDAEMWAITNEPYGIIPHPHLSEPDATLGPLAIEDFLENEEIEKTRFWVSGSRLGRHFCYAAIALERLLAASFTSFYFSDSFLGILDSHFGRYLPVTFSQLEKNFQIFLFTNFCKLLDADHALDLDSEEAEALKKSLVDLGSSLNPPPAGAPSPFQQLMAPIAPPIDPPPSLGSGASLVRVRDARPRDILTFIMMWPDKTSIITRSPSNVFFKVAIKCFDRKADLDLLTPKVTRNLGVWVQVDAAAPIESYIQKGHVLGEKDIAGSLDNPILGGTYPLLSAKHALVARDLSNALAEQANRNIFRVYASISLQDRNRASEGKKTLIKYHAASPVGFHYSGTFFNVHDVSPSSPGPPYEHISFIPSVNPKGYMQPVDIKQDRQYSDVLKSFVQTLTGSAKASLSSGDVIALGSVLGFHICYGSLAFSDEVVGIPADLAHQNTKSLISAVSNAITSVSNDFYLYKYRASIMQSQADWDVLDRLQNRKFLLDQLAGNKSSILIDSSRLGSANQTFAALKRLLSVSSLGVLQADFLIDRAIFAFCPVDFLTTASNFLFRHPEIAVAAIKHFATCKLKAIIGSPLVSGSYSVCPTLGRDGFTTYTFTAGTSPPRYMAAVDVNVDPHLFFECLSPRKPVQDGPADGTIIPGFAIGVSHQADVHYPPSSPHASLLSPEELDVVLAGSYLACRISLKVDKAISSSASLVFSIVGTCGLKGQLNEDNQSYRFFRLDRDPDASAYRALLADPNIFIAPACLINFQAPLSSPFQTELLAVVIFDHATSQSGMSNILDSIRRLLKDVPVGTPTSLFPTLEDDFNFICYGIHSDVLHSLFSRAPADSMPTFLAHDGMHVCSPSLISELRLGIFPPPKLYQGVFKDVSRDMFLASLLKALSLLHAEPGSAFWTKNLLTSRCNIIFESRLPIPPKDSVSFAGLRSCEKISCYDGGKREQLLLSHEILGPVETATIGSLPAAPSSNSILSLEHILSQLTVQPKPASALAPRGYASVVKDKAPESHAPAPSPGAHSMLSVVQPNLDAPAWSSSSLFTRSNFEKVATDEGQEMNLDGEESSISECSDKEVDGFALGVGLVQASAGHSSAGKTRASKRLKHSSPARLSLTSSSGKSGTKRNRTSKNSKRGKGHDDG